MERTKLNQVVTSERFIMFPKALFEDDYYKQMKLESKVAYSLLRERFNLSVAHHWVDSKGDVYLYYTNEELAKILGMGKDKLIRIKKELHEFGLLEEERQGFNKPNRIYVGNLEIKKRTEKSDEVNGDKVVAKCDFRKSQNTITGSRKTRLQEVANCDPINTESKETEYNNTETSKPDDDEDINMTQDDNNQSWITSQEALLAMGQILAKHSDLRPLVHQLIPDLLVNDPAQAKQVVTALAEGKVFLENEYRTGNANLALQAELEGDRWSIKLLKQQAEAQIGYMNEHLIDTKSYGKYFTHGLDSRVKIAITTTKSMAKF